MRPKQKKESSKNCDQRCESSIDGGDEVEDWGGHASQKAEVDKIHDRGVAAPAHVRKSDFTQYSSEDVILPAVNNATPWVLRDRDSI